MFTPIPSLVGGVLIGASASILLLSSGRIAGISGIVGGLLRPARGDVAWRVAFLSGILLGGALVAWRVPGSVVPRPGLAPAALIALAGLLVGFGTQLGGGCTSGHGVCGLSRFSKRSLVAVATFMTTGALATFLVQHVIAKLWT
jgi:uncharacterized membrane protein YedE/YeeE